jgi:hypothetical protein
MSHTETVTFTNCRAHNAGRKNYKIKKIITGGGGNAKAIRNFRTFICIPYFDYGTYFPEDRTIDGETE